MKTPFRNFQNFSSSLLLLVVFGFLLSTVQMSAQFVVKKDFIVTLNNDVYTLEQENTFQSDLLGEGTLHFTCLLYTSPSPRDRQKSRMPSSA